MKDIKFDFKYGEKNFQESIKKTKRIDNGYSFEIDDGVIIWQKIVFYEKFDAIYSELTFENTTDKDSKMISELNDCVDEFTVTRDRDNERNDSDTSYTEKPERKVKWRIRKKSKPPVNRWFAHTLKG